MVERFEDSNIDYIKTTIIPQLQKHNEISLRRGDTLVVHIDLEKYGINYAKEVFDIFEKAFPYNQILVVDENVTLKVVKDENVTLEVVKNED